MRSRRAMTNRNNKILPDKDGGFTVGYVIVFKMGSACHYKKLLTINIDLRHLVRFEGILNRKRVKPIVLLKLLEFLFRNFE
jgi:hypothetical protein